MITLCNDTVDTRITGNEFQSAVLNHPALFIRSDTDEFDIAEHSQQYILTAGNTVEIHFWNEPTWVSLRVHNTDAMCIEHVHGAPGGETLASWFWLDASDCKSELDHGIVPCAGIEKLMYIEGN